MVICKFNLKLYGDSCKFKGPYDKTLDFAATPFEVESGLFPFKIPQSLSLSNWILSTFKTQLHYGME